MYCSVYYILVSTVPDRRADLTKVKPTVSMTVRYYVYRPQFMGTAQCLPCSLEVELDTEYTMVG